MNLLLDTLANERFIELPVSFAHATALRALPDLHRDPFDRMLIAQAKVERLTIVTSDPMFGRYQTPVLST